MQFIKFPRTFHFPESPGVNTDDRMWKPDDIKRMFEGREVVVSLKLDGENATLYRGEGNYHARSLDSRQHPSRFMIAKLHAAIQHEIPDGWRICGENMYACHSIYYSSLTDWFYVISIWDENNRALSWDDTIAYCEMLQLTAVPLIYRGLYKSADIQSCWTDVSYFGGQDEQKRPAQEGYVCRIAEGFNFPTKIEGANVFSTMSKWVRKKHVITTDLWGKNWQKNQLAEGIKPWYYY